MEKIEKCYKLCLDIDNIDINTLFDKLSNIAEVFLSDDVIYVWLGFDVNKSQLMRRIKAAGITEFYCQPIEYSDIENRKDFLSLWYIEHFGDYQQRVLEKQKEDKLKEMLSNIKKAEELLKVQQSTQQAESTVEEKKINK